MIVALVLVYVVMCAMFESLIYPAAILTTFIFSIFGVFWLFWITGTAYSIMAIDRRTDSDGCRRQQRHRHDRAHQSASTHGLERREALIQGAKDRLRPILMTMGTAILGMVPLCLERADRRRRTAVLSDGARDRRRPDLLDTVSLLVLPTIYSLLDDMSLWVKSVIRHARDAMTELLPAA